MKTIIIKEVSDITSYLYTFHMEDIRIGTNVYADLIKDIQTGIYYEPAPEEFPWYHPLDSNMIRNIDEFCLQNGLKNE